MAHEGQAYSHEHLELAGLSPEVCLIIGVLRQALSDARSVAKTAEFERAEARRWWQNREVVQWWLDQAELPAGTYERLLAEVEAR